MAERSGGQRRVALITGASRGLGLASATHLYAQGWRVVAAMRSPDAGLERLREATGAAADDPRLLGVRLDLDDVYAASDVVVYPSRWEGFGNPPIEASLRRRPVAVGAYPVLEEIRRFGFRWFDVDDPGEVAEFLAEPDPTLLDHNRDVARRHFAPDRVAEGLHALLTDAGWVP